MLVETFEQTEVGANGQEQAHDEEALILIEKLGLNGQRNLTVQGITRCPYREMAVTEQRVYEALFPQKTKLSDYGSAMIPLRVLQVAAHADSLGIYRRLEVWHEKNRPVDPILVGVIGTNDYSTTAVHILARWGDALESFEVLYEKAKAIIARTMKADLEQKKAQVESMLPAVDALAVKHLNGDWIPMP